MMTHSRRSRALARGIAGLLWAGAGLGLFVACGRPAAPVRVDAAPAAAVAPASQPTPPKIPTEMKSASFRLTDISVTAGEVAGGPPPTNAPAPRPPVGPAPAGTGKAAPGAATERRR